MENIGDLLENRPDEGRAALRKYIRRVLMLPTKEGVTLRVSLVDTAILPAPENSSPVLYSDNL